MALTQAEFRAAVAEFATGVTVVTTMHEGRPYGMTVSAFCSVSLDPLLVLISLERTSRTCAMIGTSGIFAANILSREQLPLAGRFASKDLPGKTFDDIPHHTAMTGAPLFDEALARIDCRVLAAYPGGDHMLLLGKVVGIDCREQLLNSEPLLYYRAAFRAISRETINPTMEGEGVGSSSGA
jgi:flavin reductase (DIM6/NTAB) family NADH-FMN oxidoreductase RutF